MSSEDFKVTSVAHELLKVMHLVRTFRGLIAEDRPVIVGYDETTWAKRLYYDGEIDAPLSVLKAVREASSQLLGRLTAEDWPREGTHTESGHYSVTRWLEIYANHAHDHADQILRARRGVA